MSNTFIQGQIEQIKATLDKITSLLNDFNIEEVTSESFYQSYGLALQYVMMKAAAADSEVTEKEVEAIAEVGKEFNISAFSISTSLLETFLDKSEFVGEKGSVLLNIHASALAIECKNLFDCIVQYLAEYTLSSTIPINISKDDIATSTGMNNQIFAKDVADLFDATDLFLTRLELSNVEIKTARAFFDEIIACPLMKILKDQEFIIIE